MQPECLGVLLMKGGAGSRAMGMHAWIAMHGDMWSMCILNY